MLTLENTQSEVVDDFTDTHETGVVARGDLYDGTQGIAFYFARWFPSKRSDIELLIVLMPLHPSATACSVAFRCAPPGEIVLVEPTEIWMDWQLALPMTVDDAMGPYAAARERAEQAAALIMREDPAIRAYAGEWAC